MSVPQRERTAGLPLTLMQTQRVGSEEARSGYPPPVRPVGEASASQGGASVGQIRFLTRPQPGKETRS